MGLWVCGFVGVSVCVCGFARFCVVVIVNDCMFVHLWGCWCLCVDVFVLSLYVSVLCLWDLCVCECVCMCV